MKDIIDGIVRWMKEYLHSNNGEGYVIGVSGGVDSTVLSTILQVNNINYLAYHFKFDENENTTNPLIKHLVESGKYNIQLVDMSTSFGVLYNDVYTETGFDFDKFLFKTILKAKLGSLYLHQQAHIKNYFVPGTINLDEFTLGYFVKNICIEDLLPFAKIPKRIIREMGKYLGLPVELMELKASGCVYGTTAENEWGFTEFDLHNILRYQFENVDEQTRNRFRHLKNRSTHKRVYPPIYNL
ncbi:MAG: NAD(+) synthase [Saprospiraceae bacterium]|nr:NAD(+) synthase [Candidatus Vicinibacter affinis]